MSKSNAISVQHLTVAYDHLTVLWDVCFEIPKGTITGIIGPNGAGKSTLLKASLGVVKPLSGQARFLGKEVKAMQSKIAYVPQRREIDWDFPVTVYDVALMGRYQKMGAFKWARQSDRDAAMQVLESLGLKDEAKRQIRRLSGGQQQRLFLARSLLQEAEIYLMDEPFAGVDMATEKLIMKRLRLLQEEGKTILIVHHDLSSVEEYFDHVVVLNTSLIQAGETKKVFTKGTLQKAYGNQSALFEEMTNLSFETEAGSRR